MTQELILWNEIIGFVLPLLMSIIIQTGWPRQVQALVTFLVSVLAAVGTVYFKGEFNPENFTLSVMMIFVTAIATYYGLWKPTEIAPTLERATTFNR